MEKFIFRLLDNKKKEGTGLSIPFVIGAIIYSGRKITISELIDILENSKRESIIKFCNNLREYIITTDLNFLLGSNYYKNITKFKKLSIINDGSFLAGIYDKKYIIETLKMFHQNDILKERFSKSLKDTGWKWTNFDTDDILLIKKSI